ncbi:hypothetical protein NXS19_013381 [Fusarium pseudograminearum]|nr:hypothetical protein NXS19_013381 [Fusarium pseudograminearum]
MAAMELLSFVPTVVTFCQRPRVRSEMFCAANAVALKIEVYTGSKVTVTQTKPSDFPSFLRQKLQSSVQSVEKHNLQTESTAHETCPKCGREEVKYTTVQLRSADEGSTVIYSCECGNSWNENN